MMNESKDNAIIKKKPGRPRKGPKKAIMPRTGICAKPLNPDNCVEMIYDMPMIFKRIFTLFRAMAVKEICIQFKQKSIDIITMDHLKKSNIKITIDATKINHYYCEDPINSYLNPKNMEKIIQVIDKKYTSIAFVLKTSTSRSMLNVLFKNEFNIDEYREINLVQVSNMTYNMVFDDTNYPIKFTLPGKYFKKLINDISSISDTITIGKIGSSPLTFSYTSKDKTVRAKHIVQSPETVKLISTVCDDDIFSSSVYIDYIKPLSGSLLSDNVNISADTYKNMIFSADIDNGTVCISVNTSTINLKQ